ncbi:unnamed protein product [Cuscuta epithymum]|uniref:Uncharacterized protein n=1 Tax=Cuscuta epithymum TaxID=186058 RepID=A0AAV0FHA2_9ASTE|nr:unnamed protein product [Cuscuta epithymum]
MEEEVKKKKKSKKKKKKNKQNKTTDVVSDGATEPDHDQNHMGESLESTIAKVLDNEEAKIDTDQNSDLSNKPPTLPEGDKQYWLDREAIYEEKIKQLEKEKEVHVENECKVEERFRRQENENIIRTQNMSSLEEKTLLLETEKDVLLQQVAVLQVQISQLQNEKDSWLQKEAGYEEKISLLVDEAAFLNMERVRLEETIKQLEEKRLALIEKENMMGEKVSSLNADNALLQAQVNELEELRRSSVLENQVLKETATTLQSQVHDLEKSATFSYPSTAKNLDTSGNADADSEKGSGNAMVGNLVPENMEHGDKVNELCVELQQRDSTMQDSSSSSSVPITGNSESAYKNTNSSARESEPKSETAEVNEITSTEVTPVTIPTEDNAMGLDSSEIESSEIVQIPLDEDVSTTELEIISADQKIEVPLSDAPLIGAPFRLFSFVARYVSGADLVDKNSA